MEYLKYNKEIDIRGIEISKDNVQKCLSKGLTVIEGDAEKDLLQFPDSSFDFVILSQTLQAFLNPENSHMLYFVLSPSHFAGENVFSRETRMFI